ncbi:MAG: helix-turn-helix transcriptional regulator [Agriterribacter sp.]
MEQVFAKRPVHVGQNIQKFRFIRNKSQMDMAVELESRLGRTISQQLISDIEKRETIEDDELLKQIADILKVDAEVLTNLNWDAAINVMSNTFTNHDHSQQQFATYINNSQVYNPLDKLIELFEKEKAELKAEIERLKKEKK